jgi:hypothetical protein
VGGAYAAAVVGTRRGAGAPCSLPCHKQIRASTASNA